MIPTAIAPAFHYYKGVLFCAKQPHKAVLCFLLFFIFPFARPGERKNEEQKLMSRLPQAQDAFVQALQHSIRTPPRNVPPPW
jgi:hypothetical protein